MKLEIDTFSGYKIYPSKGRLYVRGDSKIFRFATSKNESLFLQRKNPRKIAWTQVYRRMHKKGITEEVAKKRSRKTVKHQRGIVGVGTDLASILAKKNQTEAQRAEARQKAIAKAKATKKETEAKKAKTKAPAAGSGRANAPKVSKQQAKGAGGAGKQARY